MSRFSNIVTVIFYLLIAIIEIRIHAFVHPWMLPFIAGQNAIVPVVTYLMLYCKFQRLFIWLRRDTGYGRIFHAAVETHFGFNCRHNVIWIFAEPFTSCCYCILDEPNTVFPDFFSGRSIEGIYVYNSAGS